MKNPKVFISYSWSSQTHERWVLELAENLMAVGIEVVLDKWDLKPGHDAVEFMEKMVHDPSIDKVLVVCDEAYSNKADGRHGGVGTETQIISKRIYENTNQERFIAVIAEKDEQGKAYTPIFYHSRLYIDLSSPDIYSEGLEELVRTIYNQPQHKKPQLGRKPEYLLNEIAINLGTTPFAKRANSAIRESKPHAAAALEEYLTTFSSNMERIRIVKDDSILFDEQVYNNITEFNSARNELLQTVTYAVKYMDQHECTEHLHRFLESLLKYQDVPEGAHRWQDSDFDNYRFIVHEIFLYFIAIALKNNKLEIACSLLDKHYYVKNKRSESYLAGFESFYKECSTLEARNKRLNLNMLSYSATVTKDFNKTSGVDFATLMQTDFLLFLRSQLHSSFWWPKTLVYLENYAGAFEIFTRSASTQYFENLKRILNITNKERLETFIAENQCRSPRYYGFNGWSFDWGRLLNIQELATLP
ncbi:MAG: SEFIR domain-containing protein [Gammaproteobacteria bacterium]